MSVKIEISEEDLRTWYLIEDKSAKQIAENLGCDTSTVTRWLQKYQIVKLKTTKQQYPIGYEFAGGNLIVVAYGHGAPEKNSIRQTYIVECQICKHTTECRRSNLIRKNRKCCTFCMTKGTGHARWKGVGELSRSQFYANQYSAKTRKISFDITIEQAWSQYEKQNGICALSGEVIKFSPEKGWVKRDITASLDRIDSTLGYTIDNIQWIHKDIQSMKMDLQENEFFRWCQLINDFQNQLISYTNPNHNIIRSHHKNWSGQGNIPSVLYTKYMLGAAARSLDWNITIDDMWNLYLDHKGVCAISGLPIDFSTNHRITSLTTASLDRINPDFGYKINNLQWVHKNINMMKLDLSQDRFLELCKAISNQRLCV